MQFAKLQPNRAQKSTIFVHFNTPSPFTSISPHFYSTKSEKIKTLKATEPFIGAIDFGTTTTKFIIYNKFGNEVVSEKMIFPSNFPKPGWVEQDPIEMLNATNNVIEKGVKKFCNQFDVTVENLKEYIKAVGICNQRETTLIWDETSGKPLYPAIVWNDMRTANMVNKYHNKQSFTGEIKTLSGLTISPYFSALKIKWMIDNSPLIRNKIENHSAMFGTVDSWLLWNLSGKKEHKTDVTNASRTMLMNIEQRTWDNHLIEFFNIHPALKFPSICSSSELFSYIEIGSLKGIPITSMLGDQQAALIGQKCFGKGSGKNTYGTGCFLLVNVGESPIISKNTLTTVAYQFGPNQPPVYALEGAIETGGSCITWLKDSLGIINSNEELSTEAMKVTDTGGVYFVPAFSGLYAPYWNNDARGVIVGLTGYVNKSHICRALFEAISFRTKEVLEVIQADSNIDMKLLQVDGGLTESNAFLQIQSDLLDIPLFCPTYKDNTALGAAFAAGLAVNVYTIDSILALPREGNLFSSNITQEERTVKYQGWKAAVSKALN